MQTCKSELVESLGVHLEGEYDLPPLAARIYAELVLSDQDGLSFEDCLEKRGASKGAVSTALKLLQNMGIVTYHTRPGDRRRYFSLAVRRSFFLNKLQEQLKKIEADRSIIREVNEFHKKYNPSKYEAYGQRTETYLAYLDGHEKLLKQGIGKLEKLI